MNQAKKPTQLLNSLPWVGLTRMLGRLLVLASLIYLIQEVIELAPATPLELRNLEPMAVILAVLVAAYIAVDEVARARPHVRPLTRASSWLLTVLVVALVVTNRGALASWTSDLGFPEALSLGRDYLQLILWPAVVLFAIAIFQHPLAQLMSRVKKASSPWGDFDFESKAADLAEDARVIETETASAAEPSNDGDSASPPLDPGSGEASANSAQPQALEPPPQPESVKAEVRLREWKDASRAPNSSKLFAWLPEDRKNHHLHRTQLLGQFVVEWAFLEERARGILKLMTPVNRPERTVGTPVRSAFKELVRRELVDADALEVASRAQELRNEILHVGAGAHSALALNDLLDTVASLSRTLDRAQAALEQSRPGSRPVS